MPMKKEGRYRPHLVVAQPARIAKGIVTNGIGNRLTPDCVAPVLLTPWKYTGRKKSKKFVSIA